MRRGILTAAVACLSILAAGELSARDGDLMGLDPVQSARIAQDLGDDLRDCGAVAPIYGPDCLRAAARAAARKLANNAAYWEVEVALTRINRRLDQWVRAAADEAADRLSHDGTRLRAVRPGTLPEGRAYMRALLDDAVANLRGASPGERPFFEPIAQVLVDFRDD